MRKRFFCFCFACFARFNVYEERNINVCANQIVYPQRDKTEFQETGEFRCDQLQ